ncbi:hypothetical protein [Microcoleus sp. EPA2]|uniref:hypothetical protein n=1 Tax=Microcoleus sp. EPA2 TaxID=2841654 RepID=UPI00312B895C
MIDQKLHRRLLSSSYLLQISTVEELKIANAIEHLCSMNYYLPCPNCIAVGQLLYNLPAFDYYQMHKRITG